MINLLDSKIALIVVSITAFIIAVGIGLAIEKTSDEKTTERYSSIDSGGRQTARRDGF